MAIYDFFDNTDFLICSCIWHPQEQHPGMRFTGTVHQLTEIGVLGDDDTLLPYRQPEHSYVTHSWIVVTHIEDIVSGLSECVGYCLPYV